MAELVEAWDQAAWANQVYPLDEGFGLRDAVRPAHEQVFSQPVTIYPGTPTLEMTRSFRLMDQRSWKATIRLDYRKGDEGVLLAHGDQSGGYVVYVEEGRLHLYYQAHGHEHRLGGGELPPGVQQVEIDVTAPGQDKWHLRMLVDGKDIDQADDVVMLSRMGPLEGIDIGIDRRSPVCWEIYERHGPFPYTGRLHSVTYEPGAVAPDRGPQRLEQIREIASRFQ